MYENLKEKAKTYFNNLEKREKTLLLIVATILFFFILIQLIIKPYISNKAKIKKDLNQAYANLSFVEDNINNAKDIDLSSITKNENQSSVSLINSSIKEFNIAISKIDQREENIHISLQEVVWLDFINWIIKLETNYAFNLVEIDLVASKREGFVNIRKLVVKQ